MATRKKLGVRAGDFKSVWPRKVDFLAAVTDLETSAVHPVDDAGPFEPA